MFNAAGYNPDKVFRDAPRPHGLIRKLWPAERAVPKIFIPGAQKSGTTSLFSLLCQHEAIVKPQLKEPFFFGNDDRFKHGLAWYKVNYPSLNHLVSQSKKIGYESATLDATTNYLDHPLAPSRIKELVPDAKIIILLRDPVARAHSHYKMAVRNGLESLSFADAIAAEDQRISENENFVHNYVRQRLGYKNRGQYAAFLPAWLSVFERKDMLILSAEHFFADTTAQYDRILQFLKLPGAQPADISPRNKSSDNSKPDALTAAHLRTHFAPWNHKLQQLIDFELPWQ